MSAFDPKRTVMALPVNQFLSVRCPVLSLGGEAMRRLFVPIAGGALAERARRGRVPVAGLIVPLCLWA